MQRLHFRRYRNDQRLTHYLFRYPAKFHPPVVRCLIDRYSDVGDAILDPFCGSGTLLLEALVSGRDAVGVDIDPIATFISRVKSTPIDPRELEASIATISEQIAKVRRSAREYDRLMWSDLSASAIARYRLHLGIPPIPNIEHWFRTYVVLDLAKLRNTILNAGFSPRVRNFFLACFVSVIRAASNADPVPVSGLEVTAHMRRLEAKGRRIDPFDLFLRRVLRELTGMRELWEKRQHDATVRTLRGDAAALKRTLNSHKFDVAITSPPYNNAVDYYRRHNLEMYWLGCVSTHEDRLALAPCYLGRSSVRKNHPRLSTKFKSKYVNNLVAHARKISPSRERSTIHYCASMARSFEGIAAVLKPRGKAVFVVGNSKWNGRRVRATRLLIELAKDNFKLIECFSYASKNRYMSYDRHNGADINREYVVVLERRG